VVNALKRYSDKRCAITEGRNVRKVASFVDAMRLLNISFLNVP
jgi:hypothetical protein